MSFETTYNSMISRSGVLRRYIGTWRADNQLIKDVLQLIDKMSASISSLGGMRNERKFNDSQLTILDGTPADRSAWASVGFISSRLYAILNETRQQTRAATNLSPETFRLSSRIWYIGRAYTLDGDNEELPTVCDVWQGFNPEEAARKFGAIAAVAGGYATGSNVTPVPWLNVANTIAWIKAFAARYNDSVLLLEAIASILDPAGTIFGDSSVAENLDINTLQQSANLMQLSIAGRLRRIFSSYASIISKYAGHDYTGGDYGATTLYLEPHCAISEAGPSIGEFQPFYQRYGMIRADLNALASPFLAC